MSMEEEILEKSTYSVDDGGIRLSQIQLEFKLSKINTKLGYFDNILREFYFQKTLIVNKWGVKEIIIILLAIISFILGSWAVSYTHLTLPTILLV